MAAINQGKNQAPVAIMAGGDTPESVTDAKGKVIVIPTQKDSHSEKKSGKIRIWRSKVHVHQYITFVPLFFWLFFRVSESFFSMTQSLMSAIVKS